MTGHDNLRGSRGRWDDGLSNLESAALGLSAYVVADWDERKVQKSTKCIDRKEAAERSPTGPPALRSDPFHYWGGWI